jgi:hypothetical protein
MPTQILQLFLDWLTKRGITMPLSDYEAMKEEINRIIK